MQFGILGPLEIWAENKRVLPPGRHVRWLLAAMLLAGDEPVTDDWLLEVVWGPESGSIMALRSAASRLRRWLQTIEVEDPIRRTESGYHLHLGAADVDATRFRRGLRRPADESSESALVRLDRALDHWRGQVLAGAPASLLADPRVEQLGAERVAAAVQLADHALSLGQPERALGRLERVAADRPYDEPVHARLLLLLFATGRRAEALLRYEGVRRRLAEELGTDPSQVLQAAYAALLHDDQQSIAHVSTPQPAELPVDVTAFTGRAREVRHLTALLKNTGSGPVVVFAIDGAGGIGKSALAIRVGHAVSEEFSDGCLYVNLQGSTPGVAPLQPIEVLGRFMRALGLPSKEAPGGVEEAAARFRSATSGRRILILLDNARDVAQVRPLLPGGDGSAVLVTSRRVLNTLENAQHLHLGALSPDEASTLLVRLVGERRTAADAEATAAVARACACLPLAVRVAAARLVARPDWTMRDLADRLSDARYRLTELETADLGISSSLLLSYEEMKAHSPDAAQLFHFLGELNTHDITTPVAAALADLPESIAQVALDDMVDARLLEVSAPGRTGMHDLVRLLARGLVANEPVAERLAALRRVLAFYLATARTVVRILDKRWYRRGLEHPPVDKPGASLKSAAEATAWIDAERDNLVAVVLQAASSAECVAHAVALVQVLSGPFDRRTYWNQLVTLARTAVEAADRIGDRYGLAQAHYDLGRGWSRVGHPDRARQHLTRALGLWRGMDHPMEEAWTLTGIGNALCVDGHYTIAIQHFHDALSLFHGVNDDRGAAACISNLGWSHLGKGDYETAIIRCRQAANALHDLGDKANEIASLLNLAEAYRRSARLDGSVAVFEQVLILAREAGHRYSEAEALWGLGYAHFDTGEEERAGSCWRLALALLREGGLTTTAESDALLAVARPDLPRAIRDNR